MNANILSVRAWIVTDQFCWFREKEDGEKSGKAGGGGGDYLREAINQGTVILKEMRQMTKSIRTHTCSHRLVTNIHGFILKFRICS